METCNHRSTTFAYGRPLTCTRPLAHDGEHRCDWVDDRGPGDRVHHFDAWTDQKPQAYPYRETAFS